MLPALELLEGLATVYREAGENFASLPRHLKDKLATQRKALYDDLFLFLLTIHPDERDQRYAQLVECAAALRSVIEAERSEGDSGVLFAPDDLDMVRSFLHALELIHGKRRSHRELERFFEAVNANDLAYLVIKCDPGKTEPHLEIRFTHHLSADTRRMLKLPVNDSEEPPVK